MKHIFITGANEGIGYHMVRKFLDDGDNVAIFDVNVGQAEILAQKYPEQLFVIQGDVRDNASVGKAVTDTVNRFGSIDFAIHNACVCPFAEFECMSDEDYRNTIDVNFYGAVHLCRAVVPFMKEQKRGKIFFTSSVVGVTGFPGISSYASSKGALEALSKCMALEHADSGLSFHILHPALTRTRSAKPLPIPEEIKEDAEVVGRGLAANIDKNRYIICHKASLGLLTRIMYLFPITMGRFLEKGVKKMMLQKGAAL